MPELPEVETVRRGLAELLPKHVITGVTTSYDKSFPNAPADVKRFLIGARVAAVKRRAKVLLLALNTDYTLLIHLKMTGQLVYRADNGERFGAGHPNHSLIGDLPDNTTRVSLQLDGAQLFFNDQRRFGWVRLVPTSQVPDLFKTIGPEPLAADFTAKDFRQCLLRRPNSLIKATLMDQTVIAGIGNIYADEGLWGAKIHPASRVKDVPVAKLNSLYKALRDVLELSIKKGGSSDKNYVDAKGRRGSYLTFAQVFRREGQACPRCGHEIIKTRVAGRGTHTCPHCQKVPK